MSSLPTAFGPHISAAGDEFAIVSTREYKQGGFKPGPEQS